MDILFRISLSRYFGVEQAFTIHSVFICISTLDSCVAYLGFGRADGGSTGSPVPPGLPRSQSVPTMSDDIRMERLRPILDHTKIKLGELIGSELQCVTESLSICLSKHSGLVMVLNRSLFDLLDNKIPM